MPIVSSFGTLTTFDRTAAPFNTTGTPVPVSGQTSSPWATSTYRSVYSRIYETQPAVRTCVDFLARNMAQLGLHVFRRVSNTDRVRLLDYPLTNIIENPNPSTTRFRLINAIVTDLGIYANAFLLKVRDDSGRLKGLVRMPPETVMAVGWLMPQSFLWMAPGTVTTLAPEDVVYFNGYNPTRLGGISPIETLRCLLSEFAASAAYRSQYWNNAARNEGVIERPLGAPRWSTDQKNQFRDQWQERYGGAMNAGLTPLLDEGMTFKATTFSSKDSEYVDSRKLTREEVASAYHIPLPMVGILDHASFSNITEQHKNLYQDSLGPLAADIEEEFERQLLPEFPDSAGIYLEFNIGEKLQGSFEEQARSIQSLVGRPIMTANEGRARLNLPSIKDDPTADQLAMPLNQSIGQAVAPIAADIETTLRATWDRQSSRLAKVAPEQRAHWFATTRTRWDAELARDLGPIVGFDAQEMARRINDDTAALLNQGRDPFAQREGLVYAE
jgi:HK97 family phage portal protein